MTELETANKRIAALEAELAAMRAMGEPVAEMVPFHTPSGKRVAIISRFQHLPIGTKLYIHHQPAAQDAGRKPLTAVAAMHLVMDVDMQGCYVRGTTNWAVAITRAIECAHGITAQQGSK